MRKIKFRAEYKGQFYEVETVIPKRIDHKGFYKMHGYIMRRVNNHPFSNSRGYVPEHRLVVEMSLGRFLNPRTELVHHIDGNRSNNDIQNLKLTTPEEHFYHEHFKARNNNGRFVAEEPIFGEIKFRLYDRDRNIIQIYTLKELMSKTFRRAKFEYRGRFTGLKDKNGKEIYEGDILKIPVDINDELHGSNTLHEVKFKNGVYITSYLISEKGHILPEGYTAGFLLDHYEFSNKSFLFYDNPSMETEIEVVGNVYENKELYRGETK